MNPQPTPPGVLSRVQRAQATGERPPGRTSERVALVCDWYPPRIGGIERHLAQLADHLVAAGGEVTVITPTRGPGSTRPRLRVERMSARLLPGIGLIWTPDSFRRLGKLIRAGSFDVVHVHSSLVSPAAFAALYHAQKAGLPTVSTTHSVLGSAFTGIFRGLNRLAHWSEWPIVYSGVSELVANELRALVSPHPVLVLRNAVDAAEWRLALRPPDGLIAIACVMRLVPRKRGAVLIRALRTVCSQLPEGQRVRLEIAGDGPERRQLQGLAESLGLGDIVRFLGAVGRPQVRDLLARSSFFVLPSRLEAFGIAALEARAAGLPVVAMRQSGVSEFIGHEREGLLADDDAQLAAHLLRLCTDPALRLRITEHNRRTLVDCTWDRMVTAHFAAYEQARQLCRERAAHG